MATRRHLRELKVAKEDWLQCRAVAPRSRVTRLMFLRMLGAFAALEVAPVRSPHVYYLRRT